MARNAYTLDGVPLVHPQLKYYPVQGTGVRVLPAKTMANIEAPGLDGQWFIPGASYVPGGVKISMFVKGTSHEDLMTNLEFINGLFMQRHKLLELRHDYNVGGTNPRHAFVTFKASTEPKLMNTNTQAIVDFVGEIPGVFWRSTNTVDAVTPTSTTTATVIELSALSPGNAPITDALIRFRGGFGGFQLWDDTTGHSISVNTSALSTEYIIVDPATWTAWKVTSDTWTGGTRIDSSVSSSRGSGPMITFEPKISGGALKYFIKHQATNPVGTPNVTIRAKKSFL